MFLFGLLSAPTALVSHLALSSSPSANDPSSFSSTTTSISISSTTLTAWEDLLNRHICAALERQAHLEHHYAHDLGNPGWSLDLDPTTGHCQLAFSSSTTACTTTTYQCQLVGSESHAAGTFRWAIPSPTSTTTTEGQQQPGGIPQQLQSVVENGEMSQDLYDAIFQTPQQQEIPISPTLNGYTIALVTGALLPLQQGEEERFNKRAVFLGPYGESESESGVLYLLITDPKFPSVELGDKKSSSSKLERLQEFVTMVTSVPFITHHKTAFVAFAKDHLGLVVQEEEEEQQKVVVVDVDGQQQQTTLVAEFADATGKRMTKLGDLLLLTPDEVQAMQAQQQQQQRATAAPPPQQQPTTKTGQLQMDFFQKILDDSITMTQRQVFIDCANKLQLQVTESIDTAAVEAAAEEEGGGGSSCPPPLLVEALDVETREAMLGHFDANHRMTRLGSILKK